MERLAASSGGCPALQNCDLFEPGKWIVALGQTSGKITEGRSYFPVLITLTFAVVS